MNSSTVALARGSWGKIGAAPYRLPVYAFCTALALLVNYFLGKDMAWDSLNYHLYAGFSAIHDRFGQDYFAAGPQAYFNPYAYVPFYGLVSAGLTPIAISSILAATHSVIFWLTYELAACVCPSDVPHTRLAFGLCAIGMASVNPILLQEIGSSFIDITTGELVLAGWLLLALAARTPAMARIICAGVLLGAATALKLTNAVHSLAGLAIFILLPLPLRGRVNYALAYVAALFAAFVLVMAPWSVRLERSFGNPLFPLMNGIFRSPDFTTAPMHHFRFIPANLAEALWRPFAMIDPVTMVHEELKAPDIRYAVMVVLIVVFLPYGLWRLRLGARAAITAATAEPAIRALTALSLGLVTDWIAWLLGSGNSRYFLPIANVAAVVLVAMIFKMFAGSEKIRNYLLSVIFLVQGVQLWFGTDFRWGPVPWDEHWLQISIPQQLDTKPSLYLTIGIQSNSFIAPFLASGSGLANIAGGYTLAPDGANGKHIRDLLEHFSPNVRVMVRGEKMHSDGERHSPGETEINDTVNRYGLRVDVNDCATVKIVGLPPDLEIRFESSEPVKPQSRDTTYLVSCRLIKDLSDHSKRLAVLRDDDRILDRLEDACPALFQPRRPTTEFILGTALRRYINTDLIAWVSHGSVKFQQPTQGDGIRYLGSTSEWQLSMPVISCGRRTGHFFASMSAPGRVP